MPKRIYLCRFHWEEWVLAVVAINHKHARKLFIKHNPSSDHEEREQFIIVNYCKTNIDLTDIPCGELDSEICYRNGIYTEY